MYTHLLLLKSIAENRDKVWFSDESICLLTEQLQLLTVLAKVTTIGSEVD